MVQHKQTRGYNTARQRSGTTHGESGLTDEQKAQRSQLEEAKSQLAQGKKLAATWERWEVKWDTMSWQRRELLPSYWDGSLERNVQQLQRERGYGAAAAADRAAGMGTHRWAGDIGFRVQQQ